MPAQRHCDAADPRGTRVAAPCGTPPRCTHVSSAYTHGYRVQYRHAVAHGDDRFRPWLLNALRFGDKGEIRVEGSAARVAGGRCIAAALALVYVHPSDRSIYYTVMA